MDVGRDKNVDCDLVNYSGFVYMLLRGIEMDSYFQVPSSEVERNIMNFIKETLFLFFLLKGVKHYVERVSTLFFLLNFIIVFIYFILFLPGESDKEQLICG